VQGYLQFGDPRPDHPVRFAGQDAQNIKVEGLSAPESGGVDPIWLHASRPGSFRRVGSMVTAPDSPESTVVFLEKHGTVPRQLAKIGCFSVYNHVGSCKDLSDRMSGWTDFVEVLSNGQVTDKDLGSRSAWGDSDDQHEDSLTVRWEDYFVVGALAFGEQGGTEVEREVVDLVYGLDTSCVACDTPDVYTSRLYAVTKSSGAASPGTPSEVVYSVDGGATWANVNITGLGGTTDPTGIDIVGSYAVVIDTAGGGYYYALLNSLTGVPGSWSQITTGFVANKQPNDLFVLSPNETFFVGEGGYIYKATEITAGVSAVNAGVATTSDLKRIHGADEVLVAVGESGAIVKSVNSGATWANVTLSPTSATVRAIAVVSDRIFWIGTSGGKVYYTLNGGETWAESSGIGGDLGAGAVIDDIVFVNRHVGYIAARTSTPTARLYATWDGGVSWTRQPERILNMPTFSRANRVAVPQGADSTTASNTVALGGLSGGGTDGVIYQGIANRV
jgi:photosystem II stability/assembly factor-like uncharacterized protein